MTKEIDQFKHLPEEQQKEIRANIEASAEKYKIAKEINRVKIEQRKAFKARYHEGNEYLKKEFKKEEIIFGAFSIDGDFTISYILVPAGSELNYKDKTDCVLGYCIKAPSDKFVKYIATGLCGYQIKHAGKCTVKLYVPNIMLRTTSMIREVIRSFLRTRIFLFAPEIPQRVVNSITKQIKKALL